MSLFSRESLTFSKDFSEYLTPATLKEKGAHEIIPEVVHEGNLRFCTRICITRNMRDICHNFLPGDPMNLIIPIVICGIAYNDHCVERVDRKFPHGDFWKARFPNFNGIDKVGQEA